MNKTTISIINMLRHGDDVSGEEMCSNLGVSRAAVWKHIKNLRSLGYRIDSATHRGYRLTTTPNIPYPWEIQRHLQTSRFGRECRFEKKTDSTNLLAAEWANAAAPAPEGACILADAQSAGRGRMTRKWFSPPTRNLYLSIILRPETAPMRVPQISLLGALAVCQALEGMAKPGRKPKIKWPNDVLVNNKKLAGILCEMKSEMDRVHFVVVGIGMNINMTENDFSEELVAQSTSMQIISGQVQNRALTTAAILNQFEQVYDHWLHYGLEPLLDELEKRSAMHGRRVDVNDGRTQSTGLALGYAEDGTLRVQLENGEETRVCCGDVNLH